MHRLITNFNLLLTYYPKAIVAVVAGITINTYLQGILVTLGHFKFGRHRIAAECFDLDNCKIALEGPIQTT